MPLGKRNEFKRFMQSGFPPHEALRTLAGRPGDLDAVKRRIKLEPETVPDPGDVDFYGAEVDETGQPKPIPEREEKEGDQSNPSNRG